LAHGQGISPQPKRQIATTPAAAVIDTIKQPATAPSPTPSSIDWSQVKLSSSSLDEQVDYLARDSMYFDIQAQQIHLYGAAEVKYQTMTIKAGYIRIDWKDNIMFASGRPGNSGKIIGKPQFQEGDQTFTASSVKYNFKSSKGIIYSAQSQQQGMNVVGQKAKFLGSGGDSTKNNVIYNQDAIFSTCDQEQPHFGIHSKKQKVVPDKVAIVGPSNLEIGGVPTPLWLPFGFFPLKLDNSTGLIFPQDYEYSEAYGFGLEGIGWYFPFNDYVDLRLTTDIYMKGSFRIHGNSNYRKRYKYNGRGALSFAYLRKELEGKSVFDPSMSLKWSHSQDAKAHPYRSFDGSIDFETGNYQRLNLTDAESQLESSLRSNMNYRQRFDAPFDLTASFNHSQNTISRNVTISLPMVNFQTQTLYPFKKKISSGKEKWFEKFQLRYITEARNEFTAKDTTLFTKKTLDDAKFGIRHNVTAGTNFNLLKFITATPNANYKEVWYFKSVNKTFDPTPEVDTTVVFNEDSSDFDLVFDTTSYGSALEYDNFGFKPFRQYNFGINMNTKIFGTLLFKKGKLRGLRHVISPNLGFSFSPDYTNPDWGYFKYVRNDLRTDEEERYNIFENNRISGFDQPSYTGRRMAMTYSISNLIEAKVFSKKDSTEKKLPLFRNIGVSGSYNFAADSLNWSQAGVTGNTTIFNGMTSFRFGMTFDPYDRNPTTGSRINKYYWDTQGKPLRLERWDFSFTSNMTVRRLRDLIAGVDTDVREANRPATAPGEEDQPPLPPREDFLDLFNDFSIAHTFSVRYGFQGGKDTTVVIANSISSRGSFKLTPNWRITVGNFGYDFQSKRITYPDFGFYRDLHCWEMGVNWQPLYGTYSFYLRVKPGKLDFINIPYRKSIQDARRF
jgi:LptD protein